MIPTCLQCRHRQLDPNWCSQCGHRTSFGWPFTWLNTLLRRLNRA